MNFDLARILFLLSTWKTAAREGRVKEVRNELFKGALLSTLLIASLMSLLFISAKAAWGQEIIQSPHAKTQYLTTGIYLPRLILSPLLVKAKLMLKTATKTSG